MAEIKDKVVTVESLSILHEHNRNTYMPTVDPIGSGAMTINGDGNFSGDVNAGSLTINSEVQLVPMGNGLKFVFSSSDNGMVTETYVNATSLSAIHYWTKTSSTGTGNNSSIVVSADSSAFPKNGEQDGFTYAYQGTLDSIYAEPIIDSITITENGTYVAPSGTDGYSPITVNVTHEDVPAVEQATPIISVDTNGLITASATQEAGQVSSGTKSVTKQLTTQAAQTITPSTSDKTIASGQYLTGTQTIEGDSNLVAGNIKSGVSIFGVEGSLEIDEDYVKKSGDTMSGGLDMNGYKITGLATPTASTDAVNKEYVDNLSSSDSTCAPETFGAVGDGTTDDTEAIRSCINYANENGLEVKFTNGKKYKVNQTTSIVAHCSIDFNGATIILSGGSANPFIKIEPLESNEYTLSADSLTEYAVNDEELFNKCMTIVAPISLGVRNNDTATNMPFTQTIKTDMNGNFINGKLECEIVSGSYTINSVHDYIIQTLEIKNVTVDYSEISDNDTAIFVNSYRSNVKFDDINIVGDMIINEWSYAVLGIYNSCNIEISNIRGNSPYSNGGSAYIVGLYEVADVYMHDCDFGGSATQWGCIGVSYISNFVAERVNTNRFDCHYYFTGYFTVKESTTNLAVFCGGNGEMVYERVTFISLNSNILVKRREDLDIMPSGIVKFNECAFEGGAAAFKWSCPAPDTSILNNIKYDFTHFIFENCKVHTTDETLAVFDMTSGWNNVLVDIINTNAGVRTLDSYGESKVKRAIIRDCTFDQRIKITGCNEVIIKECSGDTVEVKNTVESCMLCGNIFTPTDETLIQSSSAIIANNMILADQPLSLKSGLKYIVANNLPLYDTYKSTWENASN